MAIQVVLVSGLAGAGKSTALHALEDLGFFCVDNLPLPLLDRFVDLCAASREVDRIAVVADAREGEFLRNYEDSFRRLRESGRDLRVFFLDARDDALIRRFSQTRRRHPLAGDNIAEGIARERELLRGLRGESNFVIDTTTLTPNDLKKAVQDAFGQADRKLAVTFVSFGYKHGLPAEADLVIDVRLLRNPYFVEELRPLDGTNEQIKRYVLDSEEAGKLLEKIESLIEFLLERYEREAKPFVTIAIGCTGGRHRSVVVAEEMSGKMADRYRTRVRHRDLGRE